MAGRKPRLYDTVNKLWIDFSSLQEADALFKDKQKNPFVTTKEYGVTSRYRYDEPLDNNELLRISLGGKPRNLNSTASKMYKEANPTVDLEHGLNAVGVYPSFDALVNFLRGPLSGVHPDKPIYYPLIDEYWGYDSEGNYTNKIPENTIGSSARRKILAEAKDAEEEKRKWLSEYYNFLDGGYDALSPLAQDSYANRFFRTNKKMLSKNPNYDPKSPSVFKGRALTSLAGQNAIEDYTRLQLNLLDELLLEKGNGRDLNLEASIDNLSKYIEVLNSLSGLSNTRLAKLSEDNDAIANVFNSMVDYYMLRYYGNVAKKYSNEPENISLDLEAHGDYAKLKKFISKDTAALVNDPNNSSWEKLGWKIAGTIASLGNYLVNNAGVQIRDMFSSDEIKNELRDRANGVINFVSDKIINERTERYDGDTREDAANFDKLASDVYSAYKEHELDSPDVYTDEQKRDLLLKYLVQAEVLGQEKAELNLLKELLNRDFKEQGTIRRLLYTGNNLLNTIGTTVGHIANMAFYAPLAGWDIVQAAYKGLQGENFISALGDEVYDTWNRSLDNDFVNYLSNVEHTGTWLTKDLNPFGSGILRSLEYYKNLGINTNQILRKYGEENSIFGTTSTLYDIVPVSGYMVGSVMGAKGMNVVGDAMRGISLFSKTASVASKIGQVTSSGLAARGYGAVSAGTELASKFLGGTAKFIDATAPAMATAGMDYGYAKNNYDEAMTTARSYIESPEFAELVNLKINEERRSANLEGLGYISSSLEDKAFFALENDPEFHRLVDLLVQQHNNSIPDGEMPWDRMDAAKELLMKPYKDEYLKEAEKIATLNAGLTFGLTILPDVHMTNTWRKAMFSAQSRGAMNSLAHKAFFKPIGKVLGIKPKPLETYIEGITRRDGKWFINGKPMSKTSTIRLGKKSITLPISSDLAKIYIDQSKAGFLSNYLQDVGVAAGQGLQESMLSQYIDQRFGDDATDGISYDMTQAWLAATDRAGLAFGEITSFRDGLYGAVAPWILSPSRSVGDIYKGIRNAKNKGTKSFLKSLIVEPILKNSLLYNVTAGSKDIINKENLRRNTLHNAIETWLNTNGSTYMGNIGNLLNLSKQEKEAIKSGDYTAFNDSRLGQMVTAAIMLSLVLNFLPIKSTMMAYMKDRASRKEVNQSDIDRLNDIALQITSLLELNDEEGLQELLSKLDPSDRSIVSDLIEIRKLNQDIKANETRTEFQQLNDLRANALRTLDLIDKVGKYYLEADAKFGDNASPVVKLEYARLKLYLEALQSDVETKSKLLKKIELGIIYSDLEKAVDSNVPLDDISVLYIAKYKGDKDKLLEGIESSRRKIADTKELIKDIKSEINKKKAISPKNDEEADNKQLQLKILEGVLNMLLYQQALFVQEKEHLNKAKDAIESREGTLEEGKSLPAPIIAAKDILNLSELARLELLTSKNLSDAQKAEVEKFKASAEFANDASETNITSYIDLLQSKISSTNALRNLAYEGELTPLAIERLNNEVAERSKKLARDFYAKSFEGFAEESQYYRETAPNIETLVVQNEETGQLETVLVQDETQPEISQLINEDAAYEKFLNAYLAKIKELQEDEDSENLILGLDKALKDAKNSLYEKLKQNQELSDLALRDLRNYLDPETFTRDERREVVNIVDFATVYKSIPAENIMQSIISLDDEFMLELVDYLKKAGFEPGSAADLRNRIIQYNHNITDTIEKNKKAEEERTKKKEEKKEVKDSKNKAAEKRFTNVINAVASYTMAELDTNMTPIRDLLKALGILDADDVKRYTNNLLNIFRKIVVNSEANNVKDIEAVLDDNFKKAVEDPDVLLLNSEIAELLILLGALKQEYNRRTGSFKTYEGAPVGKNNSGNEGSANKGSAGRVIDINNGTPYSFADLSWIDRSPEHQKDNIMWQILNDAHIDDFLRTFTVTPSVLLVFITSKKWENEVASNINSRAKNPDAEYNLREAMPIIGAIKLTEFREGSIPVKNSKGEIEYYLPLGLVLATSKVPNTAIIRGNAIQHAPNNNDTYVIQLEVTRNGETTMEPISTTITVKQNGVTIDVDAGPQVVELTSNNVITANNFCVTEDGNGAKTNQVPSINKKSTERANWAVMLILELDATEDKEGRKLADLEGEDVINFNSRTLGFAETLESIIKIINENQSNLQGIFASLRSTDPKVNTSLNSRIEDEKTKVALASYISLANGYSYYIGTVGDGINLAILDKKNKPVILWTIISNNSENEVKADLIIKDLATLKTKDNANSIAKWQVSWGNFNLDRKASPLKTEYIKQAVEDRILYAFNVKTTFDVLITPVKDLLAELQLALKNAEAERRAAQAALDANTHPATGLTAENAGVDFEGAISLIQNSSIDGEAKDKVIRMLQKLSATKLLAEQNSEDRLHLAINQNKSRRKDAKKPAKRLVVSAVGGNVVDTSVRDFFNPILVKENKVTKESFVELFKDVFNEATVNNLWDALQSLNQTFIDNLWSIISSGVYTVDRLSNKIVGEVDLLALDAFGNPHIIDIKTYSSNDFLPISSNHHYPAQVCLYRGDIMAATDVHIPEGNLHLFALHLDMDEKYYDMTTDSEGVNTVKKKKAFQSNIQIKKGAKFVRYDVLYIGDLAMSNLLDVRALGDITATSELASYFAEHPELKDAIPQLNNLKGNNDEAKEEEAKVNNTADDELTPEELEELEKKLGQGLSMDDFLNTLGTTDLQDLSCR